MRERAVNELIDFRVGSSTKDLDTTRTISVTCDDGKHHPRQQKNTLPQN